MRISRKEDYAVLLLSALSKNTGGEYASIEELSQRYRVPSPFAHQIAVTLKRKGLLASKEGVNGGYRLARSPEKISLSQVLTALGTTQTLTDCTTDQSSCSLQPWCPTQQSWKSMHSIVHQIFSSITLAHIVSGDVPSFIKK